MVSGHCTKGFARFGTVKDGILLKIPTFICSPVHKKDRRRTGLEGFRRQDVYIVERSHMSNARRICSFMSSFSQVNSSTSISMGVPPS